MGTFTYGATFSADIDDRVLAHLQVVIGAKLRRNESFYFSWVDETRNVPGRTTVWLHPSIPLLYLYSGVSMPMLNREWLEALSVTANTAGGLQLTTEPGGDAPAKP
jgi:hypothetical protein